MSLDYRKMLDEAYSELPPSVFEHKRFEVPRPLVTISGSRTIFHNFGEICDVINRDSSHVLKFLSKEMATAAALEGGRVIFQGRFQTETLERLIKRYVDQYVTCPICRRPDTKIVREKRLYFLECEACGARSPVRPI
jgi:translation initiation factor 2 subunit 2